MMLVTLDCVDGARLERIEETVTALAAKLGLETKPEPAKSTEEAESVADFAARYWARRRAGA